MKSVSWVDGRRRRWGGNLLNDGDNHFTNIALELDLLAAVVTRVIETLADGSDHVGVAVVLLAGALAGFRIMSEIFATRQRYQTMRLTDRPMAVLNLSLDRDSGVLKVPRGT